MDLLLQVHSKLHVKEPLVWQEQGADDIGKSPLQERQLGQLVGFKNVGYFVAARQEENFELTGAPGLVVIPGSSLDLRWTANACEVLVDVREQLVLDLLPVVAFVAEDEFFDHEMHMSQKQLVHWIDWQSRGDLETRKKQQR